MQTTTLQLQLNTATGPAQRGNAVANAGDAGQFSAMLSNELAQAQTSAPAPAPAPQAPAPAPQAAAQASQPDQPDDTPAAPQAASTQDGSKTGASDATRQADASGKPADKTDDDSDAAAQKAGDPASAMLALMASLQHPTARPAAAAKGAAQAPGDLKTGTARSNRGDAAQLAALQGGLKPAGKDGADAKGAASKAAAADAERALGAGDKTAAASAADDLPAKLAGKPSQSADKAALDAADLSLQQARAAAQQDPSVMSAAALAQVTQPAALDAAQAAAGAEQLSAQVGTDAWENQLGQKVVYMLGNEEQTASLTLNPPDLGPMQVVLSVSNDQASVTFSSNQQEVRQALENALPRLREMMSESGIALGNASVNAGTQDQRQARQDSSARGGRNHGGAGAVDGVASADTAAPRITRTAVLGDRGMVDTFA